LLTVKQSDDVIGTIRLVPISNNECALGRFSLVKRARGYGLSRLLVEALEEEAIKRGISLITLHGQADKELIYQKLGYYRVPNTPTFLECGILHIYMEKKLKPSS
jgi:predicted GNAT family N-acyltransferase